MKKVFQLILIITIVSVTISCGEKSVKKQEVEEVKEIKEEYQSNTILQLNNGNLWEANVETTKGINNMISLLNSFTEKESLEAYAILKQNLEKEFGTIITECSMQGESHNQLHNFLIPITKAFDGFDSKDIEICKSNFKNLNKHLSTYTNFFE